MVFASCSKSINNINSFFWKATSTSGFRTSNHYFYSYSKQRKNSICCFV